MPREFPPRQSKRQLDHIPDWAQMTCAVCGEYALPDSGIISSGGKPWQHITPAGCEKNRQRIATLPVEASLMHQALVEASRELHVFVSECSEEAWSQEVADAVMQAIHTLDRGLAANRLVGFDPQEALNGR